MQQMRERTQARVTFLSDQLEQIENAKEEYKHQLADLDVIFTAKKQERDSLQNMLAPVSSLPTEIFNTGHNLLPNRYQIKFEILISHVSHLWREIAIGTPKLWSRIRRHQFQRTLEPIAVYLQRSKQFPIHLVVGISTWGGLEHQSSEDNIHPFCRMVEPHPPRCNRLIIDCESKFSREEMFHILSAAAMPILRSVRIYIEDWPAEHWPAEQWMPIFEGGAPSLTHVDICYAAFRNYRCPLDKVTTLRLQRGQRMYYLEDLRWLRDTLSAMTYLTHLELVPAYWSFDTAPITLPTLLTLDCNWRGSCVDYTWVMSRRD